MKTDTSKVGYITLTIKLSPNGNLLIGLLTPASSGTEYFQVYNSLNGSLLSSRKYDAQNYSLEPNMRLLLLNSGGTAAYVVGKHLTNG